MRALLLVRMLTRLRRSFSVFGKIGLRLAVAQVCAEVANQL